MKFILSLLFLCSLTQTFAAQVEGFKTDFPTDQTAKEVADEKLFQRATEAYRFWYPTVSAEGIMNGFREMGLKENENVMNVQGSGKLLAFTANIDTPYGSGTLDLSNGPMILEIPAGTYMGIIDDHHQRWVIDFGLPGQDAGKGGKYIILPPGYAGDVPADHFVGRSKTNKVILAIRAIPPKGDMNVGQEMISKVKIYPYSSMKNPELLKFVNGNDMQGDNTLLRWEDNIAFWQRLHKVINEEPVDQEFRAMYGLLTSLGIEKGKPFAPDKKTVGLLEEAAREGKKQMLVSAYAQNWRSDRMAWKDRKWEWLTLVTTNGNFETDSGMDLEARERYFSQAIAMSPAMTRRDEKAGSLYWGTYRDSKGQFLDGGKTYKLTIPLPVPAKLFWSVTLYDADTRSLIRNGESKIGLRSLVELKNLPKQSSVDLYFGPKAPATKEAYWVKTLPGKGWFPYFRIYGPEKEAFNGKWRPGDLEEIKNIDQTASAD